MMRVRLRAPGDESEPFPAAAAATATARRASSAHASPRTPPPRLPQVLDVRSPDFIEQRLENLKRKPNWLTYLDQYVQAHPEDDEDDGVAETCEGDEKDGETSAKADVDGDGGYDADDEAADEKDDGPGYLQSLAYAVGVVALTPVWVFTFPLWKEKGPEYWPLGSPSLWDLYKRSLWLLAFFVLGVELLYFVICKELPEWGRETLYVLQVELEDMFDATNACRAAVSRGSEMLVRELCVPIAVDIAVLQLTAWTMVKTHRRWGRFVLVVLAVLIFVDVPGKINLALQPLPVISGIDQPYALFDEEILVAFTGKNLQPGGTIAWVSYWGCASTSPVATCDLQFPATFDKGFTAVTFTAVDQFIPCYRNPPNPLKAEDFTCFEHIRLPVKDKQSIPGWSRGNTGTVETTKKKEKKKPVVAESMPDSEGAEEIAYARRLAAENEHMKGLASAKGKDEKRTSNRSKKKKLQQKIKSVTVDPATGNAMDER